MSFINFNDSISAQINSLTTIIDDMKLPHEGIPHGIPLSYDWAKKPRINWGNDPKGFSALQAWGQIYEDTSGNYANNTRVQVRNLKAYILNKKDNKWHLIQSSLDVEGMEFAEDFNDNKNRPPDIRNEPDEGISVRTGGGNNFHFWTIGGRANIALMEIGGIFITIQARLVLQDPKLPDDRSKARYLLSVGADYWKDLTIEWHGTYVNNGDVGLGRFKYVTSDWNAYNMISISEEEIKLYPPPVE